MSNYLEITTVIVGALGAFAGVMAAVHSIAARNADKLEKKREVDLLRKRYEEHEDQDRWASYVSSLQTIVLKLDRFFDVEKAQRGNFYGILSKCFIFAFFYPMISFLIASVLADQNSFSLIPPIPDDQIVSVRIGVFLGIFLVCYFLFLSLFPNYFGIEKVKIISTYFVYYLNVILRFLFRRPPLAGDVSDHEYRDFYSVLAVCLLFFGVVILQEVLIRSSVHASIMSTLQLVVLGFFTGRHMGEDWGVKVIFVLMPIAVTVIWLLIFMMGNDNLMSYISIISFFVFVSVVFPFLNAIFDCVSLLVTRYVLNKLIGVKEQSIKRILYYVFWCLIDFAIAFCCVLLLSAMLAGSVRLYNEAMLGLSGVFEIRPYKFYWMEQMYQLGENPFQDGLMVTVTLYSIMLPTLAHLFVALYSFTKLPNFGRQYVLNMLSGDDIDFVVKMKISLVMLIGKFLPSILFVFGVFLVLRFLFPAVEAWLVGDTIFTEWPYDVARFIWLEK